MINIMHSLLLRYFHWIWSGCRRSQGSEDPTKAPERGPNLSDPPRGIIIVLVTSEIFYRVKCDGREGWLNSSYDHREVFESHINIVHITDCSNEM